MVNYLCSYVTCNNEGVIEYHENKVIEVDEQGIIYSINPFDERRYNEVIDLSKYLMIPSIIDLHLHVSQLDIIGQGYDNILDDWFSNILYPAELYYDRYPNFININRRFTNELWRCGILLSSVFCSINVDSAIDLMNCFEESGMSAYIGKMNADYPGFNKPRETIEESLAATKKLINYGFKLSNRVQPAITPEFVPSCTEELLISLGNLANEYDLVVQTHFAEGEFDYKMVRERFGDRSYADIYREYGLIRPNKTLLVHGVSSTDEDLKIMVENNIKLVHCPTALSDNPSDQNIRIDRFIEHGIDIGYGSDIGGSGTINPFQNMIAMLRYSNIVGVENNGSNLTIWDCFRIMTKENGSFFGQYGVIEPGYSFSVLLIDDSRLQKHCVKKGKDRLLRFIYSGTNDQLRYRFHNGKELRIPFPEYDK
ncbi:putative guanine deaminase [[Clostridium] ultunense Esp]|uniref:Putative guanine deaminase n=1 Tax=[Clostridium] ultunense Esp TaxID=1288971 RepID=M1ZF53_9FIRM|nr:amidohydrolase family protein [Schnuerera ultunensis]CCQ96974.1 putative guanine deaminase [[Clostridium] ultunense Esp]SHD76469.1 putative guanine deaminase [[Clostridium] ultunense Esp]